MTDSKEKQKMASLEPELHKYSAIIRQSRIIEEGTPIRYHLRTESHDPSEPYRKITFGERDKNKPHKTILLVGETGTGKTKLINTMINYMLGVQREDKVWFEITDDQSDRTSVHSQTSKINVYGFYPQESPIHLTIIDTPGYGDTHGVEKDKEIAGSLLHLSEYDDCIHKLDTVCLVINATQNRLSDRLIYIFDAIQSLFGCNIDENIVLLLTYSRGAHPKDVLKAVKEAKIKCAENDDNQPVYFLFDNCQGETFLEEYQIIQEQSWNLSSRGIKEFFKFLDSIKPKTLKMTQDVLKQRRQLEDNISKIQSHFREIDKKQNQLQQTQEALKQKKKDVEKNKNFEYEVEVPYKVRVDIDRSKASVATCCTVCEENCHYPGCWWITPLLQCSVMRNNHCTVCTNKCHYSEHVKEAKIYETKTKKEKRTNEELKKKYEDNMIKVTNGVSSVKKLQEKLQELQTEKVKLVMETFHCVDTLEKIALNTESMIILLHVDFLIEKMKEINEPEKVKALENIKKRAGEEKHNALGYMLQKPLS